VIEEGGQLVGEIDCGTGSAQARGRTQTHAAHGQPRRDRRAAGLSRRPASGPGGRTAAMAPQSPRGRRTPAAAAARPGPARRRTGIQNGRPAAAAA
jgi:hypothetical protein